MITQFECRELIFKFYDVFDTINKGTDTVCTVNSQPRGIAKLCPNDKYNVFIGCNIALSKALKRRPRDFRKEAAGILAKKLREDLKCT